MTDELIFVCWVNVNYCPAPLFSILRSKEYQSRICEKFIYFQAVRAKRDELICFCLDTFHSQPIGYHPKEGVGQSDDILAQGYLSMVQVWQTFNDYTLSLFIPIQS